MPYFQNPFDQLFQGSWSQDLLSWELPPNLNSSSLMLAWQTEPYNFSAGGVLTINYNLEASKAYYASMTIDVTGVNPAATSAFEIVTILNSNPQFSGLFTASIRRFKDDQMAPNTVVIRSIRPRETFRAYIPNTGAEMELQFNQKASILEMPSYFSRHTIANYGKFANGEGMLIQLDPTNAIYDHYLVTQAGLNPDVIQTDSQLLAGRSSSYISKSLQYDGNGRIIRSLEYHTGAKVGDLAKAAIYGYAAGGSNPSTVVEEPYTLTQDDLI